MKGLRQSCRHWHGFVHVALWRVAKQALSTRQSRIILASNALLLQTTVIIGGNPSLMPPAFSLPFMLDPSRLDSLDLEEKAVPDSGVRHP